MLRRNGSIAQRGNVLLERQPPEQHQQRPRLGSGGREHRQPKECIRRRPWPRLPAGRQPPGADRLEAHGGHGGRPACGPRPAARGWPSPGHRRPAAPAAGRAAGRRASRPATTPPAQGRSDATNAPVPARSAGIREACAQQVRVRPARRDRAPAACRPARCRPPRPAHAAAREGGQLRERGASGRRGGPSRGAGGHPRSARAQGCRATTARRTSPRRRTGRNPSPGP